MFSSLRNAKIVHRRRNRLVHVKGHVWSSLAICFSVLDLLHFQNCSLLYLCVVKHNDIDSIDTSPVFYLSIVTDRPWQTIIEEVITVLI